MPPLPPQAVRALRVVADAARVARAVQRDLDSVRRITKDDRSPVTVADYAVQAIVALALAEDDPDTPIVGEERAALLREAEQAPVLGAVLDAVRSVRSAAGAEVILEAIDRCDHDATAAAYWTLDPVDGTKGFLRGQQYAIALARIERGRVTLALMGCPNLPRDPERPLDEADETGALYVAIRGEGAWEVAGDEPAAVPVPIRSTPFEPGRPLRVCESVEVSHSKHSDTARILEALGGESTSVRLDSQSKYALVARGQADAYLRLPTRQGYVERIWDHAAGSLIALEAGAVVTDITGAPLDFARGRGLERNRGIICAAAGWHERIIDAIDRLGIGAAA